MKRRKNNKGKNTFLKFQCIPSYLQIWKTFDGIEMKWNYEMKKKEKLLNRFSFHSSSFFSSSSDYY